MFVDYRYILDKSLIFVVLMKNPATVKLIVKKNRPPRELIQSSDLELFTKTCKMVHYCFVLITEKSPKSSSHGKNKFRKNHLIRMEIIASKKVAKLILVKVLAPKVLTCFIEEEFVSQR